MCCCPSPSSNGRSQGSGSATRLPLRRGRECGWAAWSPGLPGRGSRIAYRRGSCRDRALPRWAISRGWELVRPKQRLDEEGFRLPVRIDGAGRSPGGGLLSRGHIYRILSNPIYVGRIAHKGQVHEGQHPPVVTRDLWDQVQQSLRDHLGAERMKRGHQSSDALLAGKLFDDRGNRMSPSWARKGPKRWRYYVSQAVLQADKSKAGSVVRVSAADLEALVTRALDSLSSSCSAEQTGVRDLIDRVVIGRAAVEIHLSEAAEVEAGARMLTLRW